jgi:phosphatidylglycerophosphate synthase
VRSTARPIEDDEELLEAAVKANDSPFTTYLVSPWSKHVTRFGARRGWTPNAVTVVSLSVGVAAASSFAVGTRASLIAGAALLQLSFVLDCVDGQLARYTRTFSALGAWLDAVFDRMKEYLVYAGLAVGAARGFEDDVWLLAAAALTVQTVRHMADFAYVARSERAGFVRTAGAVRVGVPPEAPSWLRRGNQLVRLPIGERLALISLTAAIASPRVTFVALLVWGGIAAAYAFAVRTVLSTSSRARLLRLAPK